MKPQRPTKADRRRLGRKIRRGQIIRVRKQDDDVLKRLQEARQQPGALFGILK